jgi:hypothetical protein
LFQTQLMSIQFNWLLSSSTLGNIIPIIPTQLPYSLKFLILGQCDNKNQLLIFPIYKALIDPMADFHTCTVVY